MRVLTTCGLSALVAMSAVAAERVTMQLEWGFGPPSSEMYWDGQLRVEGGRLVSMDPVSFEPERHDRMTPPRFRSCTVGGGTDGMELVVEGDGATSVRLETRQGRFQWSVAQLRKRGELSFAGSEGGRLVVRLAQRLGERVQRLSDATSQDSEPVACPLGDARVVVLWRAFLGLPRAGLKGRASGGDQIRGVLLDTNGRPESRFEVLAQPGDVERIAVAAVGQDRCMAVWAEQRRGNWDLYASVGTVGPDRVRWGSATRLTDDPGVDKTPSLATMADGSLALVWQGWRGDRSNIYLCRFQSGRWGEPVLVSDGEAHDWNPAVAVSREDMVAVAWSRWRNGSYDVCLRLCGQGQWRSAVAVAAGGRFEAHPSLAYDGQGRLWIAYEEGREGWGMDSHTAGLRQQRNVRLRLWGGNGIEIPKADSALRLPEAMTDRSERAHLATDGRGSLWLFFRRLSGRGVWQIYGSSLGDDGWSPPAKLDSSSGGQHVRMAAVPHADGRLRVVWPCDHRTDPVGHDNYIYTALLPARPPRTAPVESEPVRTATIAVRRAPRRSRPVYTIEGRQLQLFFGDLHRHTELSVCRTGSDGSLEDAFRYAIDAAELDFLCITDHVQHVKILNDHDFWLTGKTADLHRVAGLHQPFYGYERSQRFPYGHRNIIGLRRDVRRVPRTADNRPWSANSGYEGEKRLTPPQLWSRLVGQNAITIPHTSTSPVMGTDFAYPPGPMEPVVEIYQGCRFTTEYPNAPDPRQKRDDSPYGGKTQPAGYIWNALAKGYRYGFIASSDHAATHNSYTCVWAEKFSNESILEALHKRQCYAATDKIECHMHMGGHLMGSQFAADRVPPLEVDILGTTDIARVDVIKDNQIVYSYQPEKPTRRAQFQFQDVEQRPGVHYYYARVIQEDRNMAWISPIWVELKPRQ